MTLQGPASPEFVSLSANRLQVARVDDWRDVAQAPHPTSDPIEVVGTEHRNRSTTRYREEPLLTDVRFERPDAILLVEPIGPDTTATLQHNGSYRLRSIDGALLERSHFVAPNATDHPYDYEYTVSETLHLNVTGQARLVVDGRFRVYLWGADFGVTTATRSERYRTGFYQQNRSAGTGTYVEQHYVHAIASVANGTLTVTPHSENAIDLYADRIRGDADETTRFVNASGILASDDGPVRSDGGTVVTDGGAYVWNVRDGSVAATVTEPPAEVRGGQAVPVPWTWPDASTVLPFLGVAGLVALGAALAGGPNAYARWRRRSRGEATGSGPPPRSWRQRRAAGLRALAVRAERRRWLGLGAWLLGRAVAWDRENPNLWEDYAVLLSDAGRFDAALDAHREVHALYWEASEDQIAANAYQAARTAARADRIKEARHWFRIALRRDRSLLELAEDEPDFGPVLGDAEGLPGGDGPGSA